MLTRQELKDALSEEIRLVRHIATKLDASRLDYRPTEGQRTTLELMRYLAMCGIGPAAACAAGSWDDIRTHMDRHAELTLDGFDAAMATQEEELHAVIDGLSEADLVEREAPLPWGVTQSLGQALHDTSLRFLVAYRMQLFLYAKQSGASELSTHNAWLGMDAPEKAGV